MAKVLATKKLAQGESLEFMVSCADCAYERQFETKTAARKELKKHEKQHRNHDVGMFTPGWILAE